MADEADYSASGRICYLRVIDTARGPLIAEEGTDIGHVKKSG